MVSRPLSSSVSVVAFAAISCVACAAAPPEVIAIPITTTIAPPIDTTANEPARHKPAPRIDPEIRRWEGTFFDPATVYKTFVTVAIRDGAPTVIHAEESVGDKELYEVRGSSWDGSTLTWSHYVPSTQYLVTYVCTEAKGNLLVCTWSNDHHAAGKENLPRVGTTPPDDDEDLGY